MDAPIGHGSIDFEAVFETAPAAAALLSPDFVIVAVNEAYVGVSGRGREELVGREILEVFPDDPDDPESTGSVKLRASLLRVAGQGRRDTMALQRYDVAHPDRAGVFERRYWSTVNSPVTGPDGDVRLILHRVEEVTEFVGRGELAAEDDTGALAARAEIVARGRELEQRNEQLGALVEISTALLGDRSPEHVLELIARFAQEISGADRATIMTADVARGRFVTMAVTGSAREFYRDLTLPITDPDRPPQSLTERVYRTGESIMTGDASPAAAKAGVPAGVPVGAALIVPLADRTGVRGVLAVIGHPDRAAFTGATRALLEPFALQAALALELADRRRESTRVSLMEDRDRIARDLQTTVTQRLFGMSLDLMATAKVTTRSDVAERLTNAVDGIDRIIKDIRDTVFAMDVRLPQPVAPGLRARIHDLIDGLAPSAAVSLDPALDAVRPPAAACVLENLERALRSDGGSPSSVVLSVEATPAPGRVAARILRDARTVAETHWTSLAEGEPLS